MPVDEATKRLVTEAHFRLLKEFGRNTLQQRLSDRERAMLWQISCKQAHVPLIPQDVVIEAWKEYVGGVSRRSGIAINGDVDPEYTTVGVTFDNLLTAAHTTKTKSLLVRLLRIWRRAFDSEADFLEAAERLVHRSLRPPRHKEGE